MADYLNNFKSLVFKQKNLTNINSDDKFEIIEHYNEYYQINKNQNNQNSNIETNNTHFSKKDISIKLKEIKELHDNKIEKEQLVRQRFDSDTIEQIKTNYSNYLNDDTKIVKDFANIQLKLNEFETYVKKFESDIRQKTKLNEENNNELNERIDLIDSKLNDYVNKNNFKLIIIGSFLAIGTFFIYKFSNNYKS